EYVVTIDAFVRRRVQLDRVPHPEQAFHAAPLPDQRVERADERAGIDGPRGAGTGVEVRRLTPRFDPGRQQPPLFDQFGHEPFRDRPGTAAGSALRTLPPGAGRPPIAPSVDLEIAGNVAGRPDTAGLRAETDQLLHRLLARRRRRFQRRPENHAL